MLKLLSHVMGFAGVTLLFLATMVPGELSVLMAIVATVTLCVGMVVNEVRAWRREVRRGGAW